RSTDKVVGMSASLPHQLPATQRSFRSDEPHSSRMETRRAHIAARFYRPLPPQTLLLSPVRIQSISRGLIGK
ncbi:hypothetical protein, partial [Methylobacterium oxalidis]|uniref:hypothetical protein n=1 Tax=Methylobacterium oxalidis TaxID=944322 RepID=UPI003314598D